MAISEARPEDTERVAMIRLRFLAEYRHVNPTDLAADFTRATRDFLHRQARAGTSRSWLAVEDGIDVGGVTMLLLDLAPRPGDASGMEGYVVNMYVDPSHRRRGIGRQLLDSCLTAADDLRLRRLLLYATDAGSPLYASAGFRPNPSWMELTL